MQEDKLPHWLAPWTVLRDEYYRLNGPREGDLAYRVVRDEYTGRFQALRTYAMLGEN